MAQPTATWTNADPGEAPKGSGPAGHATTDRTRDIDPGNPADRTTDAQGTWTRRTQPRRIEQLNGQPGRHHPNRIGSKAPPAAKNAQQSALRGDRSASSENVPTSCAESAPPPCPGREAGPGPAAWRNRPPA